MRKIIGIDIGASKITGFIFGGKKPVHSMTIKTPKNLNDFKRGLFGLIGFLLSKGRAAGIGIGMAGLVDSKNGTTITSPNMKFVRNLKLLKLIKEEFHLPVKIDNDVNCFTRAEFKLGQAKKYKNIVGLTLGTGIGGGLVINGQMYRGSNNFGGEAGWMVLQSNRAWEKLFQKARKAKNYPLIGELTGKALANLVNLLDPDCVVLGGSLAVSAEKQFLPVALRTMKKYLLNRNSHVKVFVSKLKDSTALGAALLFGRSN
jgi:glucokinase